MRTQPRAAGFRRLPAGLLAVLACLLVLTTAAGAAAATCPHPGTMRTAPAQDGMAQDGMGQTCGGPPAPALPGDDCEGSASGLHATPPGPLPAIAPATLPSYPAAPASGPPSGVPPPSGALAPDLHRLQVLRI